MTEPKEPTITVTTADVPQADGGALLDSELESVSGGTGPNDTPQRKKKKPSVDSFLKIEGSEAS